MKAPPNIRRIDTGNTHGWQFHAHRNGVGETKLFSDGQHGGKRKALKAAIVYRDERIKKLPPDRSHDFKVDSHQRNANNKTGVIGVSITYNRNRDGSLVIYVQSTVRPAKGKPINKKWRVTKKLTITKAIAAAKKWRLSQLRQRRRELANA